ncbi:glycerate kinase [candidate division KSB1 bacterium]|nr:glycerate kinase [candidate division KSB1 bacterium]
MKIVIAPDSFKGSLSALEVSNAIERGIKKVLPETETIKLPMADGGEGTVEALVTSTKGRIEHQSARGPLGEAVEAHYGILGDGQTAVIEMASASGLPLVPPAKRNPLLTTTFGTGELILAALGKGCREFIIGIGGSATTDCGTGMAQALGVEFFDQAGKKIESLINGELMGSVQEIDLSGLPPEILASRFTVACDVDNPLLGPKGAAHVYAPQKGATPEMVTQLETNMTRFADVLESSIGKFVRNIPGAGAAGGLGAGLIAFVNGTLKLGIEIVLEASQFARRISGASLIISGEGKIDFQTAFGKTMSGVAREAKKQNIPVIGIGGMVDANLENLHQLGINSFFSICNEPMTLEDALANAAPLVETISERIIRAVMLAI